MAASAHKYDNREVKIDKSGGDPRLELFEIHVKKCGDEDMNEYTWE